MTVLPDRSNLRISARAHLRFQILSSQLRRHAPSHDALALLLVSASSPAPSPSPFRSSATRRAMATSEEWRSTFSELQASRAIDASESISLICPLTQPPSYAHINETVGAASLPSTSYVSMQGSSYDTSLAANVGLSVRRDVKAGASGRLLLRCMPLDHAN